jgi:hypothetical protein
MTGHAPDLKREASEVCEEGGHRCFLALREPLTRGEGVLKKRLQEVNGYIIMPGTLTPVASTNSFRDLESGGGVRNVREGNLRPADPACGSVVLMPPTGKPGAPDVAARRFVPSAAILSNFTTTVALARLTRTGGGCGNIDPGGERLAHLLFDDGFILLRNPSALPSGING